MGEQTQNLQAGATDAEKTLVADPEKTLVAPRFDAREVVTAQPVVPLTDAPPARRERRQGSLPLVLILVSALVGGLVSVFAYRFYQQRVQQSSARQQQQPAASVEAPPLTPEFPARETAAAQPVPTPEVSEEPTPETKVTEAVEAPTPEKEPAREAAREDRAGRDREPARERKPAEERPAPRATTTARRPTPQRVEEITTPTEELGSRRRERREARANRRAERAAERNIDRVRAIFEGPPPSP